MQGHWSGRLATERALDGRKDDDEDEEEESGYVDGGVVARLCPYSLILRNHSRVLS